MPSAFVAFQNLDMYNTKSQIENEEHNCDGNIWNHIWCSSEARVCWCIWRASPALLALNDNQLWSQLSLGLLTDGGPLVLGTVDMLSLRFATKGTVNKQREAYRQA